jgi:NADH-quinone oxidoreductase subunit J
MSLIQILFMVAAVVTLGAGLMVVTARNLVHSALWLVLSLFGVAILYGLLQAPFLAVVQVVIYIGAIAILMIFAIMLTRNITSENTAQVNENWVWALVLAIILFAALVVVLVSWNGMGTTTTPLAERVDPLMQLGQALVSPDQYVLPFELASVLLLAALIGALVVAWDRK